MNAGHYISGAAHVGLIGWALIGGGVQPSPEPFEVTEVAMISSAEFESLLAGTEPPETSSNSISLEDPEPVQDDVPTPPPADNAPAPVLHTLPEPSAPAAPQAPPAPVERPDPPSEPVNEVASLVPPPPEVPQVLAPVIDTRPRARPAPRVAPTPVAQPAPDETVADVAQESVVDDSTGAAEAEQTERTVEEEATTEIVTEAAEDPAAALSAFRPPSNRPRPPAATPTPAETTTADRAAEETVETGSQSAIDSLLAGLQSDTGQDTTAPARPAGPPLTSGEKDALRVAVQKCWNTGALSSEALRTTVVVGVKMAQDGTPDTGSIRLISSQGGSSGSVNQAFQAARRAIIRCGARGFELPAEKYEQWRDIEMTFNPEKMRIK